MKTLKNIMIATFAMLSISACEAQIKNKKSESVKIYGNCGMCKETIEKAGNKKRQAVVVWDKQTKMATIDYDSTKTTKDEVLKRIALAGYDNELYLAPENAYNDLHSCCQYERPKKEMSAIITKENKVVDTAKIKQEIVVAAPIDSNALATVFENYFTLKDALVQSNAGNASKKATALLVNLSNVNIANLTSAEKGQWTAIAKIITEETKKIAASKDIASQRTHFINLSENMYQLIKASNTNGTVYWQHCPMANNGKGANWLSKDNNIKNPYFGEMMLNCGKTVETIK